MDKPLVTFALFAYNQEGFIRNAVEAALAQTYSPLEIILSDDGSKDRTFEIMQEMAAAYRGPHQVTVRRNQPNLGLAGHINSVFAIAKGAFVVVAAGDDISLPWRTEELVGHFLSHPDCVLAGSHTQVFGSYNHISGLLVNPDCKDLLTRCRFVSEGIQGCTFAYRRSLIDSFPPLQLTTRMEDIVFAFRAWEIGTYEVLPEVLVLYRTHSENLSCGDNMGSLVHQMELHGTTIDQICLDIKGFDRTYQEFAPALIAWRKRELALLESCVWHWRGNLIDKLRIWWLTNKLNKVISKGDILLRFRRRKQIRKLHAEVVSKWRATLAAESGTRVVPKAIRDLLGDQPAMDLPK